MRVTRLCSSPTHHGVAGVPDLLHMVEDSLQSQVNSVKLRGSQQVMQREVLHQWVVVIHLLQSMLQTYSISVVIATVVIATVAIATIVY